MQRSTEYVCIALLWKLPLVILTSVFVMLAEQCFALPLQSTLNNGPVVEQFVPTEACAENAWVREALKNNVETVGVALVVIVALLVLSREICLIVRRTRCAAVDEY